MFGISFGELMVIGIVALVVIGPEKLPNVARTLGILLGRLNNYRETIKAELHSQLNQHHELQQIKQDVESAAQDLQQQFSQSYQEIHAELSDEEKTRAVLAVPHEGESPAPLPVQADINENQLDLFQPPPKS